MESTESTPTSVRGVKAHRERVPAKQKGRRGTQVMSVQALLGAWGFFFKSLMAGIGVFS